jgi:hypothetical protein
LTDELDDVIAGLYDVGEQGAGEPPPESPPPSPVALESEQASDAPAEPETSPDEPVEDAEALKARLAEIESELQARKTAEDQQRAAFEQRKVQEEQLRAWKAQQEEEQRSQQFAEELANVDPQWGQAYQQVRGHLLQQRDHAWRDAHGARHGLTAIAKAIESVLPPEQFEAIIEMSQGLVTLPSEDAMDQAIAQQYQVRSQSEQALLERDREIAELRLRIDAMSRPPGADAVDAGSTNGTGTADWQNATTFDEFFDGMISANTAYG